MFFKNYIAPDERRAADKKLFRLFGEGLLLGGTGLGILALIFEIAADAFSVAAYQTLLAIHGASGNHSIAMLAFSVLSVMLFFGVVPAYKAGAYLRPNAGGSGPLVEAIGLPRLRRLSWIGTSLFFLDAVLTIIISSISAADVTMLFLPELTEYRILIAEAYAFFIMAVLVLMGPRRAVPVFLIGGGAFTIFTIFALLIVTANAVGNPGLAAGTPEIVERLEASNIAHVTETLPVLSIAVFFQFFMRSMSSAMLGFSGYEVIPASGKHAARPKWKVINTSLTIAAIFLITTGIMQLFAAWRWEIPATEGYSTLLIVYELVFGSGAVLTIAGVLLAFILLLAQGGGYVGGAAVAANAARLGRLPGFFENDRNGIAVIWGVAAILIPLIREVVIVESYYAFGFVTAFVITSTTVYFVRDDVLIDRGIQPGSDEAKSLRFAGLRGMIASYAMLIILITQKTDALVVIVIAGALITAFQVIYSRGGLQPVHVTGMTISAIRGKEMQHASGRQRAFDEARQRGIVDCVNQLIAEGAMAKFNVEPQRIRRLVGYTYGIAPVMWDHAAADSHDHDEPGEETHEPSQELEDAYREALGKREKILRVVEHYSHYGIFTFIDKYHFNWVTENRDSETVQKAMIEALFPRTPLKDVFAELQRYHWRTQPEEIWQFSRERYLWAKDQWPNLSDRVTTIWVLQDFGLLPQDLPPEQMKIKVLPDVHANDPNNSEYGNGRLVELSGKYADKVDDESDSDTVDGQGVHRP